MDKKIVMVRMALVLGAITIGWLLREPAPQPVADMSTAPNFIVIVSDDQSWLHTSKAGYTQVKTPNFDRIANEGVYFSHAYVSAPTCAASRASMLTGRHIWKNESAALLHGEWPKDLPSYQDMLKQAGYHVGYLGKGWGPGVLNPAIRADDPTGPGYNPPGWEITGKMQLTGLDFDKLFESFLANKPATQPFSLWIGSFEPHRPFVKADGSRFNDVPTSEWLPGNLPDLPVIREKMAGYLEEIEVFDHDIGKIMTMLGKKGLLDNTVIIVTSDNGMDFPRGKTQNYEFGVRVPLAIYWGKNVRTPGRTIADLASLVDIAPTVLDVAGLPIPTTMDGHSLRGYLQTDKAGVVDPSRKAVFSAFERHSHFREKDEPTYPRRAVHTEKFSYIRNYFPERWPAGSPPKFKESGRSWLWDETKQAYAEPYYTLATAKRPYEELYDLEKDPYQFHNIAADPAYATTKTALAITLDRELERTNDPVHNQHTDYFARFVTYQDWDRGGEIESVPEN